MHKRMLMSRWQEEWSPFASLPHGTAISVRPWSCTEDPYTRAHFRRKKKIQEDDDRCIHSPKSLIIKASLLAWEPNALTHASAAESSDPLQA